jgi:uncharacterized protein YcbX
LLQWPVEQKGLRYDRRWMLVDEQGVFMTQRSTIQMALFKTSLEGSTLAISHSGDTISLSLDQEAKGKTFASQVWDDPVEVVEVDEKTSEWFSGKLGMTCKLVSFPEKNKREVDTNYIEGHEVSLADGYPFLIIGEQSLQDLNNRLEEKIQMRRFRPNFVFSGGQPFEEDTWRNFAIGDIHFVGVKPCARCMLITIDPDTAEKGTEPLKTLATFRTESNKILFGQNLVVLDEGEIKVGDTLSINSTI